MMEAIEKAIELVQEAHELCIDDGGTYWASKNLAHYIVDEIIKSNPSTYKMREEWNTKDGQFYTVSNIPYWQEVKKEIDKLTS